MAKAVVERADSLWLSRSWTTRPPREGEALDSYVFTEKQEFEAHIERGGFLEWAEFLGNLYGTPVPSPPSGHDVLVEIEVEGALQILRRHPDATVILLLPPSEAVQTERLRGRGDPEDRVKERVEKGREEAMRGRALATHEVINDDLERAIGEVLGILSDLRRDDNDADPPNYERYSPMATKRMTLMDPPVEELLDKVDSKFTLVTLGAKRAREINAYYQGLGEMLGRVVPPQVTSVSGKPLSIAFEEVAHAKVAYHHPTEEEIAAEEAAAADAEAFGFLDDPFAASGDSIGATITEFSDIVSVTDGENVVDIVDTIEIIEEEDGVVEVVEEIDLVVNGEVVAEEIIADVVDEVDGDDAN